MKNNATVTKTVKIPRESVSSEEVVSAPSILPERFVTVSSPKITHDTVEKGVHNLDSKNISYQ